MPETRKRGLLLAKLAALALSTLIAVLCIEVFIRVAGRDRPLLWEPDARLGWHHIPNAELVWTEEGNGHVRINSGGFRDVERSVQKDRGVFRIAVFGDSTTEAIQVDLEQTYCQLLEARLRQRGIRAEVLNVGVSGYGALQDYLLYSERVREYAPDLVLHAVFLDNDVADGDRRLAAGQRGAPFLKSPSAGDFEIDYSSAVASVANYHRQPLYAVRKLSAIYRMLSAARARNANITQVQTGPGPGGQVPKRFLLYADPLAPEWEEAWQTFERIVVRFSETVRRDGRSYAMVSLPAGQVVYPEVWQKLLSEYPAMASRTWDVLSAEKRMRQLADDHQITLISPHETFVRSSQGDPLFFQQIGHLTPRGHDLLAGALDIALSERQLVPAAKPVETH